MSHTKGVGPPPQPIMPPLVGPSGGVAQVTNSTPFHGTVQYHAFPNYQGNHNNDYYEIFRSHGHPPCHFPILQKYKIVPNTVYYELCGSPTHTTKQCCALDALADRIDRYSFRVDENPQGFGGGHRGGGGFIGG
jgi:hypothetical protein